MNVSDNPDTLRMSLEEDVVSSSMLRFHPDDCQRLADPFEGVWGYLEISDWGGRYRVFLTGNDDIGYQKFFDELADAEVFVADLKSREPIPFQMITYLMDFC